jgi:hypothetical protein
MNRVPCAALALLLLGCARASLTPRSARPTAPESVPACRALQAATRVREQVAKPKPLDDRSPVPFSPAETERVLRIQAIGNSDGTGDFQALNGELDALDDVDVANALINAVQFRRAQ